MQTARIHVMIMHLARIFLVVSIAHVIMASLAMGQNVLISTNARLIEITVIPMQSVPTVLVHSHVPVELDSLVMVSHV